jgi:hypothetical protein
MPDPLTGGFGMRQDCFDWDIATPERAARALVEFYGPDATLAAAHCGLAAYGDDRHDDYRFWYAVFARLRVAEVPPAATVPAPASN